MGWWLRALEWHRDRRGRLGEERAAEARRSPRVTLDELAGARYALSAALYRAPLTLEDFAASDPLSPRYVGSLEADLVRVRNEVDGEWA